MATHYGAVMVLNTCRVKSYWQEMKCLTMHNTIHCSMRFLRAARLVAALEGDIVSAVGNSWAFMQGTSKY
jgi:hypothetical protein